MDGEKEELLMIEMVTHMNFIADDHSDVCKKYKALDNMKYLNDENDIIC